MAGRKSVKRGIRKSRKGLRKRNGKKTYKRSIKKGGIRIGERDYDCEIANILIEDPRNTHKCFNVLRYVYSNGDDVHSNRGEKNKEMKFICKNKLFTLQVKAHIDKQTSYSIYSLYGAFDGNELEPLFSIDDEGIDDLYRRND